MVKSLMNAVYVAIGLAFARKIYEKACSDPYGDLKRAARAYHGKPVTMLVGEKKPYRSIVKEIIDASRQISQQRSMPVIPTFPSTPKLGNSWKPFPWSPMDKEL